MVCLGATQPFYSLHQLFDFTLSSRVSVADTTLPLHSWLMKQQMKTNAVPARSQPRHKINHLPLPVASHAHNNYCHLSCLPSHAVVCCCLSTFTEKYTSDRKP